MKNIKKRLLKKILGKDNLIALQLSERGEKLFCTYMGEKVKISGEAVTYSMEI